MSGARYDYSEWDGTQQFADLDPDDLLAGLTDDLLAGGDLDDALDACSAAGSGRPTATRSRDCGTSSSNSGAAARRCSPRATPTAAWPS